LIWDAFFVEWYFPALHHGKTHLAVDFADVARTVAELRGAETSHLRKAAKEIYETFLSKRGLVHYLRTVLERLKRRFPRVAFDKDKLNATLAALGCGSRFHLLEFRVGFDSTKKDHPNDELHSIPLDDPDLPICHDPSPNVFLSLDKATASRYDYFFRVSQDNATRIHHRKKNDLKRQARWRQLGEEEAAPEEEEEEEGEEEVEANDGAGGDGDGPSSDERKCLPIGPQKKPPKTTPKTTTPRKKT